MMRMLMLMFAVAAAGPIQIRSHNIPWSFVLGDGPKNQHCLVVSWSWSCRGHDQAALGSPTKDQVWRGGVRVRLLLITVNSHCHSCQSCLEQGSAVP
jgi:hypothetical protein